MITYLSYKKLLNLVLVLTAHKELEMHGCIYSNVATDALVLKHQGISSHSADSILILSDRFHVEILQL